MRRRPPLRVCRSCGAHFYAWSEAEPCPGCRNIVTENRQTLAGWAREQRLARRTKVEYDSRGYPVSFGGGCVIQCEPASVACACARRFMSERNAWEEREIVARRLARRQEFLDRLDESR